MTNRRFFIGPIPEGWLFHHRKSWYKAGLKLKNYSSKTVSFSADPVVVRYEDDTTENEPSSSGPEQDASQNATAPNGTGEEEETQGEGNNEPNEDGLTWLPEERDATPNREIGKSQNTTPTTDTGNSPPQGKISDTYQLTYPRCCLVLYHGQRSGWEYR